MGPAGKDFGRKDLIPLESRTWTLRHCRSSPEAMTERAKHPTYGYTFPSEGYYESFIEWNRTRNHFDIKRGGADYYSRRCLLHVPSSSMH